MILTRSQKRAAPRSALAIFAWPLIIALATLAGLIVGLTGDGMRDSLSLLLVGLAPLVILIAWLRRDR